MRNIFLSGAAAFVLALGATNVNAAPVNDPSAHRAAIHLRHATPHRLAATLRLQEGRSVVVGEDFSARFMGDHAQDPAFSRQQDEIYAGRF